MQQKTAANMDGASHIPQPVLVILDGYTLNPGDLSWKPFDSLGKVQVYARTPASEIIERSKDANILLVNKVQITQDLIARLPNLRCICVTATGYNNIDIEAAAAFGIAVYNAVGYGVASVAQHVFALLLACTNHVAQHVESVRQGDWAAQPDFSYWKYPLTELQGKTMGIYGFGRIGQKVAEIALALGMRVIATHKHPERDARPGVTFTDLPTLCAHSDVMSINVPLTTLNRDIMDAALFRLMKPTAILINTGRGELIVEADLAQALRLGRPALAALDVLRQEPPIPNHPLIGLPNCLVTPHQAWASQEARQRLMDITYKNVHAFLQGSMDNRVT